MFGSDVTNHVRHLRLMDEFDKFAAREGESLEYVYKRLTTLVNIMHRNNVHPISVSINTNFLNCLKPEWSKYVTIIRHNQTGETVSYDQLYDSLVQFEPHSPQSYYVTHPSSVVDYEEDYQGELQGDSQEDKLTTAMMMVELTYKPRMQDLVEMITGMQGDRTRIKHLMQEVDQLRTMTVIRLFNVFHELSQIREWRMFSVITAKKKATMLVIVQNQEFVMQNKTSEELTAAVIMMAQFQPAKDNDVKEPRDDANIIFDGPYMENNGGYNALREADVKILAYNALREAKNKKRLNNDLKKQKMLLQ
ncbi:hypothetical protein Tco_0573214 [Tanacetum coccineum]